VDPVGEGRRGLSGAQPIRFCGLGRPARLGERAVTGLAAVGTINSAWRDTLNGGGGFIRRPGGAIVALDDERISSRDGKCAV